MFKGDHWHERVGKIDAVSRQRKKRKTLRLGAYIGIKGSIYNMFFESDASIQYKHVHIFHDHCTHFYNFNDKQKKSFIVGFAFQI